jgi:hypothetical protein
MAGLKDGLMDRAAKSIRRISIKWIQFNTTSEEVNACPNDVANGLPDKHSGH